MDEWAAIFAIDRGGDGLATGKLFGTYGWLRFGGVLACRFAVSTMIVRDNDLGMTFEQCQGLYPNVGYNRRIGGKANRTPEGRPVLGRKGIGELAGFGISNLLEVDTTSRKTGERTVFQLKLDDLRSGDYINTKAREILIITREQRSANGTKNSRTIITLKGLTVSRISKKHRFAESMARRFLINQVADAFKIKINGSPLPEDNALSGVEFPRDYKEGEKPKGLKIVKGIGYEKIDDDEIEWRIKFMKDPISTEELRGVSVFCGIKVAQTSFFFNLSGGLRGQHGQQYVSGQVRADYLDRLTTDVITTERQRINWEIQECKDLEKWGQERVKSLLAIWQECRAAPRLKWIEDRTASFSPMLERLKSTERRTLSSVLKKVAMIETLSEQQCRGVLEGILKAWDRGHLRDLIEGISDVDVLDEKELLKLLAEEQVLTALNVAEVVGTKLGIIRVLREGIEKEALENKLRNHIAENPWLLSPEWETFKKETTIKNIMDGAAVTSKLCCKGEERKRVDLALSSGEQLLIVEFMRPGVTVDHEHINQYQAYIDILRSDIERNTGLGFKRVSGLLVADKLHRKDGMNETLKRLDKLGMNALEWAGLLLRAEAKWKEFSKILISRAPDDERLVCA